MLYIDSINLKAFEDRKAYGNNKLYKIQYITLYIEYIYDSADIPGDFRIFFFVALPKKSSENECELHCNISFMSHITKFITLMNRTFTE